MDGWNSNFLLGFRPIFRGYLSFREGIPFLHPTPLRLRTLSNSPTSLFWGREMSHWDLTCHNSVLHILAGVAKWKRALQLLETLRTLDIMSISAKGIPPQNGVSVTTGRWFHSYFCHFHPENCGRWIQFDERNLPRMGCFLLFCLDTGGDVFWPGYGG